ncbi:SapC family protein [Brevundimonas lutea]|uniref:SapC family protein n=1 Tax=Brevundimonas lutea TaxID=2293980 RepID=UPI000F03A63D|nr:SapC family protein [Brevundimonas lutea]
MQTTQLPTDAALSGNVLFYSKPEPLSVEAHGKLGVNALDNPYAFVGQTNMVPLTVTEFAPAALNYPVVFLGDARAPVAIMGLNQNTNLFVEANGAYRADAYLPAFVRRYPFVFATQEDQGRMVLCIDREAPMVSEGGETALFADGKPTPFTENAMKFCTDFEQERRRTESFVKLLQEHNLLTVREFNYTPRNADGSAGQPQKVAEFYGVSEEKLNALSADTFKTLRDNGALGQIYAHLMSLQNWDRLIVAAMDRAQRELPAANA